jgi:hypothetical protein
MFLSIFEILGSSRLLQLALSVVSQYITLAAFLAVRLSCTAVTSNDVSAESGSRRMYLQVSHYYIADNTMESHNES